MAELSHMLATFRQQACSAAVMVWPGVIHAANGSLSRTSVSPATMKCEASFNIVRLHQQPERRCLRYTSF